MQLHIITEQNEKNKRFNKGR